MSSANLTETVHTRVDGKTKRLLEAESRRSERSEGAIVRIALREYLAKMGRKG